MKETRNDRTNPDAAREIQLDRLLGRRVLSGNNQSVGRLEEFRVEEQRDAYRVTEYVIGKAGLLERLGVGFKLLFGTHGGGYVARWDQLDISDPDKPRLTCRVEELRTL
jgi:hypothetical protein